MPPPAKRQRLSPDDATVQEKPAKSNKVEGFGPSLDELQQSGYMRGTKGFMGKKDKVKDKKLAAHLSNLTANHRSTAALSYEHDRLLLPQDNAGLLEPENELERTYKVRQDDIKSSVGIGAAAKGFELDLPTYGPYALDYTSNGRHIALAGRLGHVATFDWQTGNLNCELNLNETVRDIAWLHNNSFFAVAQKKYVYIYDNSGLEVHQLRHHIEVNKMAFLRYHFLLATVGNAGFLKYQDTSTGQMVSEARTKLGACDTMTQNPHTAIINLGHHNGTVTLWSPTVSQPHVKLLAHLGPVRAIACDPSSSGNHMATAGLDGRLKVWDIRTWKAVNEWKMPTPVKTLAFSQKGLLGVGWGNHVSIYQDPTRSTSGYPGPYMTNAFPGRAVHDLAFCPYDDILGTGHATGLTHLLVPGAGEANYDAYEADPYEGRRARREREVAALMDKIPADQITMDRDLIGKLARPDEARVHPDPKTLRGQGAGREVPFARKKRFERLHIEGKAEEDSGSDVEEGEEDVGQEGVDEERRKERKRRVKGANKVAKRVRRKRANVETEETTARREKAARMKIERKEAALDAAAGLGAGGALNRFSRPLKRA